MGRTPATAAHSLALRAGFRHIGGYAANTLAELALRLLCLSPLIYLGLTGSFFGAEDTHMTGIALLCCLPLWLLVALPLRFRLGGRLCAMLGHEGPGESLSGYPLWLSQVAIRLLRALPSMLPLLLWLGAYYYYIKMVDFPSFFLMIRSAGGWVGGGYVEGMALLLLLFLLCLWLCLRGWRRVMAFFYLPLRPVSEDARRYRALDRGALRKVTLINFLILLPALAVFLTGTLFEGLSGQVERDALSVLTRLVQFDLSALNIGKAAPYMLVLYLPFVLWRKLALAEAIHGRAGRG